MNAIERRLQVLESECRRTRRINRLLLIVGASAIACIGGVQRNTLLASKPTTPKPSPTSDDRASRVSDSIENDGPRTIEAEQFVLIDQQGRRQATLVATAEGPSISMFDEAGRKRLELSHSDSVSAFRLFDSDQSAVVSLQLPNDSESALFEIRSSQGSSSIKADGLSVYDANQFGRLKLALLNGDYPVLGINGSGQNGPPSIEMTAGGTSRSVKVHDKDGHPHFTLVADDGRTFVDLRHPDHERSMQISMGPLDVDGPRIAFFAAAKVQGHGGLLPYLQLGLDDDCRPFVRIVDSDGRTRFAAPTP